MIKRYLKWLEKKGYVPIGTLESSIVRLTNKGMKVIDWLYASKYQISDKEIGDWK